MSTVPPVRVYYQIIEDARERAQGRFLRFQAFDESDAGRNTARASRYLPTTRTLSRAEFERGRERIILEAKRAAGLDRKEKELQVDFWTKEAATLVRARNHGQAVDLLKKALALVPGHAAAQQGLGEAERMMKAPTVPSDDYYQLCGQIRSISYQAEVNGRSINQSGSILADYVFCPKGRTDPGYQPMGRPHTKTEILRDHVKIVQAVLREKNLVVSRVTRGSSKAVFWTKGGPSGWQVDACCVYRDLKEPRTLLVKQAVPLQT